MSEQSSNSEQSKGRTDLRNISLMKFKGTDKQLYMRIQEDSEQHCTRLIVLCPVSKSPKLRE